MERKYFYGSELESKFGLSKQDLLYLVKEKDLKLSVEYPQQVVIGHYIENKFVGYASAFNKGFFNLTKTDSEEVIEAGKTQTNAFIAPKGTILTDLNKGYSWDIPFPNDLIEDWKGVELSNPLNRGHAVLTYPQSDIDNGKVLKNAFDSFLSGELFKKDKSVPVTRTDSKQVIESMPKRLVSPNVSFTLDKVLLTKNELIRLDVVKEEVASASQAEKLEKISFSNEFLELLHRILIAQPDIKAKALYQILECEANGSTDKVYDTNDILLDEVGGRIVWRDKYANNAEKTLSMRTIENKASEVRRMTRSHRKN